jgi:2-hydroxychromene-2-carboxylate isomerase
MTVVISADIITHWERKIFDFILLATSPWARLAEEAVCDLNEKLTVSLSLKIPESPALFCRNGALAGFSNGLPLHEYQAVDIQRICDREGEQVTTGKGSGYILAHEMGHGIILSVQFNDPNIL